MAVTDLLLVITAVILNRISRIYFPLSLLSSTPGCSLSTVLIYMTRDSSVWLTVAFTFDRFIAICLQKLKGKHCTERTAAVVIGTVNMLCCLKNIPYYFTYEPLYVINDKPWFCSIKATFYSSPVWKTFDWLDRILTPCAPFFLILLLNALTIRHILAANRARRRLRAPGLQDGRTDPEVDNRRRSIVLLFAISGTFILLWMTYVVNFFYVQFCKGSYFAGFNFSDLRFILQESANMLQLFSCCTNSCIYAITQSRFRQELKDGLRYPLNAIARVLKQ
ncbi:probable G-protein coupled receptor 139 [Rhincodon typus]|uniref:probable G-protein coupled receptor 139 n=1 Tax=Rhincodon typus TaxID=259920 RepID=UPI00202F3A51|nr:probable G-protein coupled receptor 139 [Rhincodon typus]